MPSSRPSVAELRAVCQPPEVVGRRSAEHWAGRLYMRRVSIHATRLLVGLPVSANVLTGAMVAVGLVAAGLAAVPALWAALATLVGVQAYLLLDCSDGEVARWRGTTGPTGVYLDRVGHYVVEAALFAGVGVRADGGVTTIGGWTTLGLLGAVFVQLVKAEADLVTVARVSAGLAPASDDAAAPRHAGVRGLRSLALLVPLHRVTGAVELSLLLGVVATYDAVAGGLAGARALVALATAVAGLVAAGRLASVLSSQRLR